MDQSSRGTTRKERNMDSGRISGSMGPNTLVNGKIIKLLDMYQIRSFILFSDCFVGDLHVDGWKEL